MRSNTAEPVVRCMCFIWFNVAKRGLKPPALVWGWFSPHCLSTRALYALKCYSDAKPSTSKHYLTATSHMWKKDGARSNKTFNVAGMLNLQIINMVWQWLAMWERRMLHGPNMTLIVARTLNLQRINMILQQLAIRERGVSHGPDMPLNVSRMLNLQRINMVSQQLAIWERRMLHRPDITFNVARTLNLQLVDMVSQQLAIWERRMSSMEGVSVSWRC